MAVATFGGEPDVQVVRRIGCWVRLDGKGYIADNDSGDHLGTVTDIRPLVLLDLPDPESIIAALDDARDGLGSLDQVDRMTAVIDQIEAQTRPPKIAEPTNLLAVVRTRDGWRWCRWAVDSYTNYPWRRLNPTGSTVGWECVRWDNLDAVELVSEGVPS